MPVRGILMSSLLYDKPKDTLEQFLREYSFCFDIDIDKARSLISVGKKHFNKKPIEGAIYQDYLEGEWYRALDDNRIDYSVYNDEYYFTDLWLCWEIFSRGYLRAIKHPSSLSKDGDSLIDFLDDVATVVDLGCGIGYTTAALKEIFPHAKVYGTNLKKTRQFTFCQSIERHYKFRVTEDKHIKTADFVFASEYFEHILAPAEHVEDIISRWNPSYLYLANSFNTKSVGHFREYWINDDWVDQKDASRAFNAILGGLGYQKVKTCLWNDKPALWAKK